MTAKSPEFIYICETPIISNNQGSLNGLRLGVKDLFDVAGIPTSAGNPEWLTSHPQPAKHTAPSVEALLAAGATIIGKTLTDELAYSLEGVNKHYGTPINPQAPQRLPGGSSSGSAVAVANGSVDLGLGSDTGGSIRVPASYNGLYGLRPSHGAISTEHLIPLAPRFDTVGWMTRDFSTMMRVAKVLLPSIESHNLSHLVVCNIEGIKTWTKARQPLLAAIESQFESIEYVEITTKTINKASAAFRVLQGREIWRIHGQWIEERKPDLAAEISDRIFWCKTLSEADERKAENTAQEFIDRWHTNILTEQNEVLLLPTTPGAAPLLNTPPSQLQQYRNNLLGLTAFAGLTNAPQINLPYLSNEDAPWGVSLLTHSGGDRPLLDCVSQIETALSGNRE